MKGEAKYIYNSILGLIVDSEATDSLVKEAQYSKATTRMRDSFSL